MGKAMEITGKVPASQKFGYACSGLSYCLCMLVPTFLIYYATEQLAIAIGAVSMMMMLVKIFDGITDIVAGVLVDKTKSKYGKARPWFLWMSIPYAACLLLMFCIPQNLGTTAKLLLLAVMYALTVSVFGTIIGVARIALAARMTTNEKERGVLGLLGDGISSVVVGLGMALTLNIVGKVGWATTFGVYAIFVFVTSVLCFALTREQSDEILGKLADERNKTSIKTFFEAIFKNKYALLIFVYVCILFIGSGTISAGGTYYFQYVYGDVNAFMTVMLMVVIAQVIGIVAGSFVVKKMGIRKMFIMGCVVAFIFYIIILVSGGHSIMILGPCLGIVALFGQDFTVTQLAPLAAAAVDYSEYNTGIRQEGITSSVVNIGIKIGTALATGILGLIMNIGGYVEGGVEQTARAIQSINIAYMVVPCIAYGVLALVFALTYKLEKEMPEIQAELARRHAQ